MEPTARPREAALRPVETAPGVLVHPAADRDLAAEHWLLSTLTKGAREQARGEWTAYRLAVLPMGTLLSAVRLPARLVLAVSGGRFPSGEVDRFLGETFEGGPVICDPNGQRYYALVPASVPRTYKYALDDWRTHDVDVLGKGCYLGVPRLDVTRYEETRASYWSVPMPSMATLCPALSVARLIGAGAHLLAEEAAADAQA